jgi:hypothetical protein
VKGFKDTTKTTYSCGPGARGPGLKGAAASGHTFKTYKDGAATRRPPSNKTR